MKESLIIDYLMSNEEYFRTVLPHLKREYFSDNSCKTVFGIIEDHYNEYGNLPNKDVIEVTFNDIDYLKENDFNNCVELVNKLNTRADFDLTWAVDKTEQYCRNRSVYNAIMDSIKIYDGSDERNINSIPSLMEEALATRFQKNLGHNYVKDSESRFENYGKSVEKIPFDIEILNNATRGGIERKTLNLVMGPTGVGKTLVLCHLAASWFLMGYKVLYITMEMAEEKISRRIDSNILDIDYHELEMMDKNKLNNRMKKVRSKTTGDIIVREFPTSGANSTHFKYLIDELKLNENFIPDIIVIDYLNICSSSKLKANAISNPYLYYKTVAEELRALSQQTNTAIFSATQTNRGGFKNSDTDMDDTSDSWGLPMTIDLMIALIVSDELTALGQMMLKQLKSRYDDKDRLLRFVIGVDKNKMRLYDVEQNAQENITDDAPIMDKTSFGNMEDKFKKKRKRKNDNTDTMGEFMQNV
jgi:KaiC/GvpD/RAD55 family RecA-like ATPase